MKTLVIRHTPEGIDAVAFENVHNLSSPDEDRSLTFPVLDAGEFSRHLARDRFYALEIASKAGLLLPRTFVFSRDATVRGRMMSLECVEACGETYDDARECLADSHGAYTLVLRFVQVDNTTYRWDGVKSILRVLDSLEETFPDGVDFILQTDSFPKHLIPPLEEPEPKFVPPDSPL